MNTTSKSLWHRLEYLAFPFGSPALLLALGAVLLGIAALLLQAHAAAVGEMRSDVLPTAAKVAPLEERLSILRQQVEATKLAAALRPSSAEERLHVFVLPEDVAFERAIAMVNTAAEALRKEGMLREMSPIKAGEILPASGSGNSLRLAKRSLSFSVVVTDQGAQAFASLLRLAGLLTLHDALTPEQSAQLFSLTEHENPAGITALGQFLSTDLLSFILDPKPAQEHLLSSFSSDAFAQAIRSISQSDFFQQETALMQGPVGQALQREHLWPLPFVSTEEMSMQEVSSGWQTVSLRLVLYGREQ